MDAMAVGRFALEPEHKACRTTTSVLDVPTAASLDGNGGVKNVTMVKGVTGSKLIHRS